MDEVTKLKIKVAMLEAALVSLATTRGDPKPTYVMLSDIDRVATKIAKEEEQA